MGQGKRIRKVRKEAGLWQGDFAFLIGTSQSKVSKWEMEKEPVPAWVLHVVAEKLKVRENWLRLGTGPMKQSEKYHYDAPTVSREACGGCYHFINFGEYKHCDYIGHERHCRPCKPGKGCTEYITEQDWRKKHAE